MSRFYKRAEYLDSYSPGDATRLLGQSFPFLSLPASTGSLAGLPQKSVMGAIFDSASKFQSKNPDQGASFQRFLTLQNNPDALLNSKLKVPTGFSQALGLTSSFGS